MEEMKDKAKDAGEWLVKWGYIIRGWLYISIGWLAIKWAFGISNISPGGKSAINHLSEGSFGKILLVVVIIGLIGYAGWGALRAWREKKLVKRLGYLTSSGAYLALVWPAINILISGQKSTDKGWKYLLNYVGSPLGRWIVIIVGLGVIGAALNQAWDSRKQNKLGRIGLISRSCMIGLAGIFLVLAGIKVNPHEPAAFDQAIIALGQLPFGNILITVLGGGLIALGIHSFSLVKKVHPAVKNEPTK